MADITGISNTAWANVTLAADEVWQCKGGKVMLSVTNPTTANSQGVILSGQGDNADAVKITSGKTVYYKAVGAGNCIVAREAF